MPVDRPGRGRQNEEGAWGFGVGGISKGLGAFEAGGIRKGLGAWATWFSLKQDKEREKKVKTKS